MSSTRIETESSSSGILLYIQVCYSVFYMHSINSLVGRKVGSNTLFYRLPEDETSDS